MAKPVGWRNQPARHSLASRGIKTGHASNSFKILEGKRGSVDEITRIIEQGKRYEEDYPEEAMKRYLSQFKEPWKQGTLEFYRLEGTQYQIWTSLDGTRKAILAGSPLYSDSDSRFATMESDLMIKHLTDAAEELAKHGDFAKLMPTYGMMNKAAMMEELTRYRGYTEDQVYRLVDAEHNIRTRGK